MALRPLRGARPPDPATGRLVVQPARVTMFLLAGVLLVGVLTFMSPTRTHEPPIHPASAALGGCAGRGGVPTDGPFKERYCRVAFADGGKRCTDKSQCQGACIVLGGGAKSAAHPGPIVGVCETANVQYGCFSILEQGAAVQTACVD